MKKAVKFLSVLLTLCVIISSSVIGSSAVSYPNNVKTMSDSILLVNMDTGEPVYEKDADSKRYPASTTKIMTYIVVVENIDDLDNTRVSIKKSIIDQLKDTGSSLANVGDHVGETMSVIDLLYSMMVPSGNDAAMVLADYVGDGDILKFVQMMNDKAKELGMKNTCFKNSHGIDEEGHYTTAKDIAIMSRELITKHPDILKYTSIWQDTLRDGTFGLNSTNKLIRFYEGATGLKTGSTSQALFNLSGTATRNGTSFIAVVMRAPSSAVRLEEVKQLLDYGFANYEVKNVCEKGVVTGSINVNKCVNQSFEVAIKDGVTILADKGAKIDTVEKITYNDNLIAPISNGDEVGNIEIFNKDTNEKIGESKLIILKDVPKSNLVDYIKEAARFYLINKG